MNKLHLATAVAPVKVAEVRARDKGRPGDLFASIRVIGKTAMFAVEVVEIIGFGLALL